MVNYSWNDAWTLFMLQKHAEALPHMERTARMAPENPEVLYDLAVIRLAADKPGDDAGRLRRTAITPAGGRPTHRHRSISCLGRSKRQKWRI